MAKRLILIHGRAEKPRKEIKEQLLRRVIEHGLKRIGAEFNPDIVFDLAYYGDVNNAILWAKEKKKKLRTGFLDWDFPYEEDLDAYDLSLEMLFRVTEQNEKAYKELRSERKDLGAVDNLFDVASPVVNFFGLGDNVLNGVLADMGAYFKYRFVGSLIRERLQSILVPALENGDDICLVAHSMGTIVAYDVLWKISRMSEYKSLWGKKVNLFVTLGAPLGEKAIRQQLYDAHEPEDGVYPTSIRLWHNFSAMDDFVAHDEDLADNFEEMIYRNYVSDIVDHFIYTFYVGGGGTGNLNPHKFYGYLDNAEVARVLARWMHG